MVEKKQAVYRLGVITFGILAVLTAVEYAFSQTANPSLVLLFIIAFIKSVIIVYNFMNVYRLWSEESH